MYAKTVNLLCADNKVFVNIKLMWGVNPNPPPAYVLDSPFFCSRLYINKLNRAAIFSSQKRKTIFDYHLWQCFFKGFQKGVVVEL